MAMMNTVDDPIVRSFEEWYEGRELDPRDGSLDWRGFGEFASILYRRFETYKREMDIRCANYYKLELLADGEVISRKADLPNVSSGETAGMIRRVARNLVQNAPNVDVLSKFDNDSMEGVFSNFLLKTKVIGSDEYSNDMQQNLFASTKTALTLGFDCVVPVLLQRGDGSWYMKYDNIHYRDVFPEPGAKDVRDAPEVFVRRYLSEPEVKQLILDNAYGWDIPALKTLLKTAMPAREEQSVSSQDKKRHNIPLGYEIITWYNSYGQPFLTFDGRTKMLLRVEKNKHPQKSHPVHFLVLENDSHQPLGKSQVELLIGRQEFQDLMLNGSMKMWYRNINPPIIGYGTVNVLPNLSPGKFTEISNPNARIEAFEVNTQTLLQQGPLAQQNMGSMVNLIGSADQQMATQAGGGMSATPQGVEAQQAMVDITTNNYQKAIESFFSHYCSYALTLFIHEMRAVKGAQLNADTRLRLLKMGFDPKNINEDGTVDIEFERLATEYWVKCVPGSLTELEDEKQLRILNQLFVPLSQAMPALAAAGDQEMIKQAAAAMKYIVQKQIELSGSSSARDLQDMLSGQGEEVDEREARIQDVEDTIGAMNLQQEEELAANRRELDQLREQMRQMTENQGLLLEKLGVLPQPSEAGTPNEQPAVAAVG